jgi:hypothetical protein
MNRFTAFGLITSSLATLALLESPVVRAADETEKEGARAAEAELALSNDTLDVRYLDRMKAGDDHRLVGGVFLGEKRDLVLSAAAMFPVDLGTHFELSVGPQLYAALLNDENEDVMAVSVGAELRYFLDSKHRVAASGQAYYAPDILSFGAADNLVDLSARVEYQLSSRVNTFAGMRWFRFDLTEGRGRRTLQEEVFVGIRYKL